MFQTAGYPVHPPYFTSSYDYRTPPRTPPQTGGQQYYSPRYASHTSTPGAKGHHRRATGDPTSYTYTTTYTTTTPRKTTYYAGEPKSTAYYASAQSTPQRSKPDYVSDPSPHAAGAWHWVPADDGESPPRNKSRRHRSSPSRAHVFCYDGPGDPEPEYLPRYEAHEPRPPPYRRHTAPQEPRADRPRHAQVPVYTAADTPAERTTPRRASYAPKPTPAQPHSQPPPPRRPAATTNPTPNKPPPKATADDARRAGIPAGYSTKNWDPTEEPILLLGSVFDANSLGKWIYDWTVFFYGAATPMTEVAGDLWLLLIQLAGKIRRAEGCLNRIRRETRRDVVEDFLEAGERLWQRFNKLLKICENFMWRAAKKCGGTEGKKVTMGENSGCEFVDSIFGRDRELERTEKLMTGMRLWSMRFDANCEEILRNPAE